MKNALKVLCMALCMSVLFSMLAACGSRQESGESSSKPAETVQTAEQTTEKEEVSNLNAEGYPVVKEKVTLKAFLSKLPFAQPPENMKVLLDHEARTNVHIEWTMVPPANAREKINLIFASNDLPDFFVNGLNSIDEVKYGSQGTLIALNSIIEKYGTNIKNMFAETPLIQKAITAPDGNIYALCSYVEQVHPRVPQKHYINKAWLDKLGLQMPETTEDFYNVLKAFKNGDPNGNGKADEIPLLAWNEEPSPFLALSGPWGVVQKMMVENGQVFLGISDNGYKEALKFYAKLFKEGLIDAECFTMNEEQARAKGSQELAAVGSYLKIADFQIVGADKVDQYAALPPLKGPDGTRMAYIVDMFITKGRFAITNKCENPEAALRWVDYAFSKEGGMEFCMGLEGTNWEYTAENPNEFRALPVPEGISAAEFRHQNTLGAMGPFYRLQNLKEVMNDQEKRLLAQAEVFLPYAPKEIYPTTLYYTEEQAKKLSELNAVIDPYISQMAAKFITGGVSVDAEWDNYVATLKKMGSDDMLKIYQEAYENYEKN